MVYFISIMSEKVYFIAEIYGMCGGVHAALNTLEKLVASQGQTVYVFNELVHNNSVTGNFIRRGVHFVNRIEEVPLGATLVIGAHGVSPSVEEALRRRAGTCHDASCPLVKKLHQIAGEVTPEEELIIFGKAGHPEVEGVAGYSGTDKLYLISSPEEISGLPEMKSPVFISQTTVDHGQVSKALELLTGRFANLRVCSGVCDASRKRQEAVLKLVERVEAVLVVGSGHSSNARRLCELARSSGAAAFLIDNAGMITPEMTGFSRIGITSGASTPQYLFNEVVDFLENLGFVNGQ